MELKNFEVMSFGRFIMLLSLSGKKSRMRTRFVKLLQDRQDLIDSERLMMLKELADKDEDGNPKTTTVDGNTSYILNKESMNKFDQLFSELLNEEFAIDETAERKEMLLTIRDAILDCELEFSGQDAVEYDRFCEIVEGIKYEG